jgi:hypothetical protein
MDSTRSRSWKEGRRGVIMGTRIEEKRHNGRFF